MLQAHQNYTLCNMRKILWVGEKVSLGGGGGGGTTPFGGRVAWGEGWEVESQCSPVPSPFIVLLIGNFFPSEVLCDVHIPDYMYTILLCQ